MAFSVRSAAAALATVAAATGCIGLDPGGQSRPTAPSNVRASYNPVDTSILVMWTVSPDPDSDHYNILRYRGTADSGRRYLSRYWRLHPQPEHPESSVVDTGELLDRYGRLLRINLGCWYTYDVVMVNTIGRVSTRLAGNRVQIRTPPIVNGTDTTPCTY